MDTPPETISPNTQDVIPDELQMFWEQQRQLRSSPDWKELRTNQRVKRERDFVLNYLAKLTQQETATEAEANSLLITKVRVSLEAADLEEVLSNPAAKEHLLTALPEAQRTKDEQTIYSALMHLGQFHLSTAVTKAYLQQDANEDYDEAILYFQRSISYARYLAV